MGCLAGWDANMAWKYGLQAESTNLWARRRRPSTARVTSTKASLWSKWSNTETRADWWLFHRRQNCCWGDGEDEAMVLLLLAFDSCTKSQSVPGEQERGDETKHNHCGAKLWIERTNLHPNAPPCTKQRSPTHFRPWTKRTGESEKRKTNPNRPKGGELSVCERER